MHSGSLNIVTDIMDCSPSFISSWANNNRESALNHTRGMDRLGGYYSLIESTLLCIAHLRDIKTSIHGHNVTLYRACANANPHNMNEAMIGISKEVSIFFSNMQQAFMLLCRSNNC